MIQFNLLPDVKIEYIKAQRMRQVVLSVSILVTAVSLSIFGVSFGANLLQKNHIKKLSVDITTEIAQLKGKKQINKILTVQNQLQSLTTLHDGKPALTRLFGYLDQVTPNQVTISNFNADMVLHKAAMTGQADSLSTINKYVDTLKFTTYTADGGTSTKAFTKVVLGTFNLAANTTGAAPLAGYSINFEFDPLIFDITKKIILTVPNTVTTRSQVDKPVDLFNAPPASPSPGTLSPTTKTKGKQ